nr:neuron navigator 3 [Hymenolepis microstoma]
MRNLRKSSPVPSKKSTTTLQLQFNSIKKLPAGAQQQSPCSQTLPTLQKYRVTPLDLMRPVKTKAETVLLYTEWANHYLQKAGYNCVITDLQSDLRDGKMLVNLTNAVVNENVNLKGSNNSPKELIAACLKVLEGIGVDVHDVSVEGIMSGRLKCILGLFFNLSKFKQKLRECQYQPKSLISTGIPQKFTESSNTSTSLDSPDSDKRYVTPPSSVQSSIQYQPRPISDPQALKKSTESKSRLPVLRQIRNKNCPSDLPQSKILETETISSLPTQSLRSPQPIKNQKPIPIRLAHSTGSSGPNHQTMLPIGRIPTAVAKPPTSSLQFPTAIQTRFFTEFSPQKQLRKPVIIEAPVQNQPIGNSVGTNNVTSPPPHFVKTDLQLPSATSTAAATSVSQLPTPTLSFSSGVLRLKRPSDFAPQGLTASVLTTQTSSKPSSVVSLNSTNGCHNLQSSINSHPDLPESINEEKDEEDSPLGSGEINRAMSELEDVNPGTWSGRLPPALPGLLSASTGHFYLTTARQRTSFDPHLRAGNVASLRRNNDEDNKSIKSECLPIKSLDRPVKPLAIPTTPYSSDSNLVPPDTWSNSLPNRSFREFSKSSPVEPSSSLVHLRARADGREESSTERIYGPLGFIKLPYEHPRSHSDHQDVKVPHSVIGCVNFKHSAGTSDSEAEVCHLRRELELARQKVTNLTSQLESNTLFMDRLYPNFYSLHATTPAEPLEPRFKRRSWNAFPENAFMPYTVYTPVQDATLQRRMLQRCSSEAPTSRRISTFLPDNPTNQDQRDDEGNIMNDNMDESSSSISPIPPIAIVKPTLGRMDSMRRIHRPQPCYGVAVSTDMPPPCMQMSTPEVYFSSNPSFKQPATSLPRRRNQLRRERLTPAVRHSVFEYPNVVDYGPLQDNDHTLRRRARRQPEAINTAPISRRPFRNGNEGSQMHNPNLASCMASQVASSEEEHSSVMMISNSLPPACIRSEHPRRVNRERACLVSNFEQSLANMAQRLQSLTVSAAEKDSELRELRQIIDAMVQERSTPSSSVLNDQNSAKPPFSPSSMNNLNSSNAATPIANITDNGEMEEETSNSLPPGTPKSSGVRKGGWLRSSIDKAFRRRGSQTSLVGDPSTNGSQLKHNRPSPISAWNSPEHRSSHVLRKNFVRASSVSADVSRPQGFAGNQFSNGVGPTPPVSAGNPSCCEAHTRCCLLESEVENLRKELAERESRLTDAQLQALASAHQVDQLRDQLNLLFQQLSLLRADNERLHASVANSESPPLNGE